MAAPNPDLIKALNKLRDEMMRLHAAFYAGTLSESEQQELAKHCLTMMQSTKSIAAGTKRPPSEAVYVRMDELDPDELTYIERIRSKGQMQEGHRDWTRKLSDFERTIGMGKIVKEGDKI